MREFACYLSQEALLQLRGNNIAAFLQGQLSCDTRLLNTHQAVSGAFCNVKGRVVTDVTVIQVSPDYCLLRMRASLAESVAAVLSRYAQFSRISVEVCELEHAILGSYHTEEELSGEAIAQSGALTPLKVEQSDGLVSVVRADAWVEHILFDASARSRLESRFEGHAVGLESIWRSHSLRQGHYALELADSEQFTPQALNYDETGLVAFNKGCYTGQEVVARLHYKGKSKKRLGVYTLPATATPASRNAVICDAAGDKLGQVLRCESDVGGIWVLAAEIRSDQREAVAYLENGPRLAPALPYVPPA